MKILDILSEARQLKYIKAKGVASLTGKINSMWLGLGNIVRLTTRALYRLLQGRDSWHDCLQLDSDCINEIEFWFKNIRLYNDSCYGTVHQLLGLFSQMPVRLDMGGMLSLIAVTPPMGFGRSMKGPKVPHGVSLWQ